MRYARLVSTSSKRLIVIADRCMCEIPTNGTWFTPLIWRHRCQKTSFIQPMYIGIITLFAEVVLAQRFNVLDQFELACSFLPSQNVRNNEEEQMDCGYPVYSCNRRVLHCGSHFHPHRNEPRSIHPPRHTGVRISKLKGNTHQLRRSQFLWIRIEYAFLVPEVS